MATQLDDEAVKRLAEDALRSYLIRCHRIVSKDYPKIAEMLPVEAADHLLHLKRTGKLDIKLFRETQERIGCRIIQRDPEQRVRKAGGAGER